MEKNAGKGDSPRNNHSKEFKSNYDEINWGNKESKSNNKDYKRRYIYKKSNFSN